MKELKKKLMKISEWCDRFNKLKIIMNLLEWWSMYMGLTMEERVVWMGEEYVDSFHVWDQRENFE